MKELLYKKEKWKWDYIEEKMDQIYIRLFSILLFTRHDNLLLNRKNERNGECVKEMLFIFKVFNN